MTVPNAGDFIAQIPWGKNISISCPNCDWISGHWFDPTIRDLIAAASEHARSHAREQVNA